jgi:hypothetical protein
VLDGSLIGGGALEIITKTWRGAGRAEEDAAAYPADPARHMRVDPFMLEIRVMQPIRGFGYL